MTLPNPLALWLAAVASLALGLRGRIRRASSRPCEELPPLLRIAMRVSMPDALARLGTRTRDEQRIVAAGLDRRLSAEALARVRVCAAVLPAAAALATAPVVRPALVAVPILGLLGCLTPDRWLLRRARRRRTALVRELPDLLDLLGICVESGMALDPALRMTTVRLSGVLSVELRGMLRELDLGTPRRAAYRGLASRVASPELAQVVGALLQAEELGAPLSDALSRQADTLRSVRRQRARDRAARSAPRIQLVVALLMVPAALLLVLGVMIMELGRQVGAVVGG